MTAHRFELLALLALGLAACGAVCSSEACKIAVDSDRGIDYTSLLQVSSLPIGDKAAGGKFLGIEATASSSAPGALSSATGTRHGPSIVQTQAVSVTTAKGDGIANVLSPALIAISLLILLAVSKPSSPLRDLAAKYVAEFVGTFVLVFTVGCCVNSSSAFWNPLAIACALMVMVYAMGYVSGGHLNPAVSFTLMWVGELEVMEMLKYWLAQFAGAYGAAGAVCALFGSAMSLAPAAPYHGDAALTAEFFYTFMLCFVVLNCAASKRNNNPEDSNQFFGLAIGFVIVAGGYAAGNVSGACFNPAVSMAVDIGNGGFGWGWIYGLVQLIAGISAGVLYRIVRPQENGQELESSGIGAQLLSEFLGVFFLVLTVLLNVIHNSAATALSAAAALMCMIYALGDISGAHFNPAVTLAVFARGKLSYAHGLAYLFAQFVGGLVAGLIGGGFHLLGPTRDLTFHYQPGNQFSIIHLMVAELIFTFVLAYVVLAVATTERPVSQLTAQKFYVGLAIGSCVTAGGFAAGAISGGCLNPSVTSGVVAMSALGTGSQWLAGIKYVLGGILAECVGGLLAAAVFRITHPKEFGTSASDSSVTVSKLVCEFLGTFVLVFTVGCSVLIGNGAWAATAIASALMVMIYAVGPVSGGHLNPAVSFAVGLAGACTWVQVLQYWIAQLAGGAIAGVAYLALLSPRAITLQPTAPFEASHALFAEAMFTFMLCFVVLNCAASKRNNPPYDSNQFFALAIAFVIVAGGYSVGGISGACFNPAVAFGLDVHRGGLGWGLPWALAELFGAGLAAFLYFAVRPEEKSTSVDSTIYKSKLPSRLLSEFIGTFILVATVGLNLTTGSLATAWSAAAALMCMIYALGGVSGGHFNPAVTLAVVTSGRDLCEIKDGVAYAVMQLAAGALAGVLVRAYHNAGPAKTIPIDLVPGTGYTLLQAGFSELIFTFVLAYVVLAVATSTAQASLRTKQSFHFALAIGSCVTAGGVAVGSISGGELNPAVGLGIATQAGSLGDWFSLAGWECSGALLAGITYRMTHPAEYSPAKI